MNTLVKAAGKIKIIPGLLKDIYEELRFFFKELKVSVYRIEGTTPFQDKLTIYHISRKRIPEYFLAKFYAELPSVEIESRIYLWQIPGRVKMIEKKTGLLFVRTHAFLKYILRDGFIAIPEYIKQILDVKGDEKEIKKNFHKGLKKTELRRIRKYGYSYEISTDPEKVEFFYQRMYIPFTSKRHQEYAHLDSLEIVQEETTAGIMFLKKDNQCIGGASMRKKADTLIVKKFGIIDADDMFYKHSILGALYYFIITFAKEEGYKKVDLGFTPPILSDGILIFKNKWGSKMKHVWGESSIFLLKICQPNDSLKKILADNPLITIGGGKLVGCAFSHSEYISKLDRLNIKISPDYFNGLDAVKVVNLN